jgi:hypothetical protein
LNPLFLIEQIVVIDGDIVGAVFFFCEQFLSMLNVFIRGRNPTNEKGINKLFLLVLTKNEWPKSVK